MSCPPIAQHKDSARGPSTPVKTPTRPPGRPSCRSMPPAPTRRPGRGRHKGYEYSRSGNPTRTALETALAALEEGESGLAFASGLAASTAVFGALLRPGDEVAASADLYGGTFRLLDKVFKPWGLTARYTDDFAAAGFEKIITPKTKLVWVETPTNPLLQILDIAALADVAHKHGAKLAVDNTFASPYLQRPLTPSARGPRRSTARRSTSAVTRTWSAGAWSVRRMYSTRSSFSRTRPAVCRGRSTRIWFHARPQDAGGAHKDPATATT